MMGTRRSWKHLTKSLTLYAGLLVSVCIGFVFHISLPLALPLDFLFVLGIGFTFFPVALARYKPVVARRNGHPLLRSMATASKQPFFFCRPVYNSSGALSDLHIRYANAAGCAVVKMNRHQLLGLPLISLISKTVSEEFLKCANTVLLKRSAQDKDVILLPEGDLPQANRLRLTPVARGLAISALYSCDERAAHHRVEELNRFTQSVFDTAPVSIIATDATGLIVAMNNAAEQLTHYRRHELVGLHSALLLHDPVEISSRSVGLADRCKQPIVAGFESLVAAFSRATQEREWTYVRRDGKKVWVNLSLTRLRTPDQRSTGYMAVAFDISERKELAEAAYHMAHHDHLTGLLNRSLLEQRIQESMQRARELKDNFAVILLDIDHFKRLNDSLGHAGGDAVLLTMAKRLLETVRSSDTVFRIGGDEFVLILQHLEGRDSADLQAAKILKHLSEPFFIETRELRVTASLGYCLFPDGAEAGSDLLHKADLAMYAAKSAGRSGYRIFCDELRRETTDRIDMEEELRHAIEREEFIPHYQPQVDCESGEVSGMEMLLRWRSLKRGVVLPDIFLPIAEQAGLMAQIAEWGIRRACLDCADAQKALGRRLRVAVNLSSPEFQNAELPHIVREALSCSHLAADDLELEITEQTLMASTPCLLKNLGAIRNLGVRLAIDDFGTGFSNFSYILQYSVDTLKIDRSFISKARRESCAASVVTSIITMAHGLGLRVCAEGVETDDDLEFLALRYCDEMQGFLFSRPVPLDIFCNVVRRLHSGTTSANHAVQLMSFRARTQHVLSTRNHA